jgi:GR25 family glycosyltransferase involved in LPS biosynthesis
LKRDASMAAAPPYHGTYINLERSAARRQAFEQQLLALKLETLYTRFPATDGASLRVKECPIKPGELGCFHSHAAALRAASGRRTCVHILEDDAVLSEHVRPVLESAIAANLFDRYDILFTDMFVNCHIGLLKFFKDTFRKVRISPSRPLRVEDLQVIDLAQQNFSCLTSYVVAPGAIDRILALYHQELAAGPRSPVDLFIRDCVLSGKLRAACLFPFVTTFDLREVAASTIAGTGTAKPSVMVMAALRYSFFIGRDLGYAQSCLDAATSGAKRPDEHEQLIGQVMDFVLSDDFREF